jgi:AraC-like DNA-binding protein
MPWRNASIEWQKTSSGSPDRPPMLRPPVTVPIAFVRGMVSGLDARGQSSDAFLVGAGIAPQLLQQPSARITAEQYSALFRLLIEELDDECVGLMSRPLKRGSLALMTRSALTAPTLDVAIRRVASTFRLLQDDFLIELARDAGLSGLSLRLVDPSRRFPVFLHELLLRVFWRVLAWLAGGTLDASRFEFAFPIPAHAASYGKVFPAQRCFACQHTAVWFDSARLEDPVRRDESALRAFIADAQRQVIVPKREDNPLSSRVRENLQTTMPAWPDLATVAGALHMAPSTVQRRLAIEGTSFQALKDELRRDLAIVRLNSSSVSLATLSCELGFADSAAFQRAFKGWTGSAPGAYRRGGP